MVSLVETYAHRDLPYVDVTHIRAGARCEACWEIVTRCFRGIDFGDTWTLLMSTEDPSLIHKKSFYNISTAFVCKGRSDIHY